MIPDGKSISRGLGYKVIPPWEVLLAIMSCEKGYFIFYISDLQYPMLTRLKVNSYPEFSPLQVLGTQSHWYTSLILAVNSGDITEIILLITSL